MSQIFFVGVAIFLCTFMFCSLLPGILLYEYGYKPEMAWAERAVETNCFISKYSVESVNCGMQRTSCFVAILSVSFTTTNGQNISDVNINACDDSYSTATVADVNRCVAMRFAPGTNITCYYDSLLPRDVRLVKQVTSQFYAYVFFAFFVGFFFALCFLGAFITSTWRSKIKNVEKEMKNFF